MLIRPKQLPIDPTQPFALDKLGREESAGLLTQLLERVDTPFVLAIDAKWGDGKTTFLEMWKHHLMAHQIRSLYFNAWESDYSSDPVVSFIGEMRAQLEHTKDAAQSTRLTEKFLKVKEAGVSLAKCLIPFAVKLGTGIALDALEIKDQSVAEVGAELAKEKIEHYEADKKTVKEFKKRLQEFIKELGEQASGKGQPVVFLIDELDRCRPTYTIELLERVKHFFDVEGLIFVLSLDKEQLGHSIRAVYGSGIDVDGYLRRFIDLDYRLPKGKSGNFVALLAEQYQLRETVQRSGNFSMESISPGLQIFECLASVFNLSLRQQQQTMAMLIVVLLTSRLAPRLGFLISLAVMKIGDSEFYNGLIASRVSVKEVMDRLETSPVWQSFKTEDASCNFEACLISWKKDRDRSASDKYGHYQEIVNANQRNDIQDRRADMILKSIQHYSDMESVAASHIKALEISGQFKNTIDYPTQTSMQ